MRAIAESGRALEMNTRRLWPWVPQWWAEEGGREVTFGSDAHEAGTLAANFPEAMAMAESFASGRGVAQRTSGIARVPVPEPDPSPARPHGASPSAHRAADATRGSHGHGMPRAARGANVVVS